MDDYVRNQFEKLGEKTEIYKLKVRGAQGETHWLSVPPAKLAKIREILESDA